MYTHDATHSSSFRHASSSSYDMRVSSSCISMYTHDATHSSSFSSSTYESHELHHTYPNNAITLQIPRTAAHLSQ